MSTPFAEILDTAMRATPRAVGGAFAAFDGETVDFVSTWDDHQWLLLTAHYGVVLAHVQAALHTFHFGEAESISLSHEHLDIVIHAVKDGYYALMAIEKPCNLARATRTLERAANLLREEMG